MPTRLGLLSIAAFALLIALVAGCGTSSTRPAATPLLRRTVTAVLTDSLGAPLAGQFVRATSLEDSAGFGTVVVATTGAAGEALFLQLREGAWAFATSVSGSPERVAGVTTRVPGSTRPEGDTILVAMGLHIASSLKSWRWLSRETDHSGTLVNVAETGALAETESDGSFSLAPLAPGRWTLVAYHRGYRLGVTPFEVPLPGSIVTIPGDSLAIGTSPPPERGERF